MDWEYQQMQNEGPLTTDELNQLGAEKWQLCGLFSIQEPLAVTPGNVVLKPGQTAVRMLMVYVFGRPKEAANVQRSAVQ